MKINNLVLNMTKLALVPLSLTYYIACSPVKFEKQAETPDCASQNTCVVNPEFISYDFVTSVSGAKVDILFVNDNSGSMSYEQSRLAQRFDSFIQALDQKSVDYRIGMITTDVSNTSNTVLNNPPRTINRNGALQDGRLVPFRSAQEESSNIAGVNFLVPSTTDKFQKFANTISRKETLQCENFLRSASVTSGASYDQQLKANCPSGDERGIAAANLFIRNHSQNLVRSDAQLAIIFLSDEDVMSGAYYRAQAYRLTTDDMPQQLVNNIRSKFLGKQLSIHSIIVRPGALDTALNISNLVQSLNTNTNSSLRPESIYFSGADSTCLNQQSNQTFFPNGRSAASGSYGIMYALASQLTEGIIGDVCANDYGSQLDSIGRDIAERVDQIGLQCDQPLNLNVQFSPAANAESYQVFGRTIQFANQLKVGTQVRVQYNCRRDG